jgi:DNA-binding response OmpR family regulator
MAEEQTKKKILVVEDERPLLMAIKSKLENEGYDVEVAEDGAVGEKKIEQWEPDLVLLDILLPKKDGFEILEGLEKKKIKLPIIIISNSGQPVEIERALKLGVKDYLIKADFSPSEVLKKVKEVVGPGVQDGSEKAASGDLSSKTEAGGETVLIVEDDEFLRQLVGQKLEKEGFKVANAIDSAETFKVLEESKPHIILLDLILPGMDGFEILNQLKKDNSTSGIPVIVLSNLGQKEDIERAMAAGAEDYLIKANFTPSEIVEKIRTILRKRYL